MKAIVSVSNKIGVADFARGLSQLGFDVYSTGGTKKTLQEAEVKVHSISELTGFPEILGGRVKTLHPVVHGGILARRDLPEHMAELAKNKIETIDLVAVNLYPFVETVSKTGVSLGEALENIDIGGPTMIRAAAKNFPSVLVLVDPQDYMPILEKLRLGKVDLKERQRLACKAFQHVALYDTVISRYLREDDLFPEELTIGLKKSSNLRYGENPHQQAALYIEQIPGKKPSGVTSAIQLHGPELSFNNYLDLDAAVSVVTDFLAPTVAIIKHNNPCGLASHNDLGEAYRRALEGDPVSAFGGVVASNRPLDLAAATEMDKTHFDAIIAPGYDEKALEIFKRKKNLRLLSLPSAQISATFTNFRQISGGFLLQTLDVISEKEFSPRPVTKRAPTEAEMKQLAFAWKSVKNIKSNAIVLVKDEALLGMGAGQPSRVVSVKIALEKAGDKAKGSVLGSDAFFPFPDGVELAAKGGVTAIIQPGGSVKDDEAIATANRYNMAMVFTGARHFKH